MSHPLTNNPQWTFWQPYLAAKSTVLVVDPKDNTKVAPLITSNTCREGILSNMRSGLWKEVMEERRKKGRPSYEKHWKKVNRVRLYDPRLLEELAGANQLRVHANGLKTTPGGDPYPSQERIEQYLQVCDAIVGMPCVLLSHKRPEGEWWRSEVPQEGTEYISWNGSDNWFMRHPALLAAATGLIRQAALLVARGYGEQVLETVDRKLIEEALTTGDWKLAYDQAIKLRPWIEVPVGQGGAQRNYSFPLGFWPRFDHLQRAQRRHNYQKIFDSSFYQSWGLTSDQNNVQQWSGTYSFWGERGNYTDHHRRLMELGKPRRRSGRGKGATRDS